jgi:hypothetical protein
MFSKRAEKYIYNKKSDVKSLDMTREVILETKLSILKEIADTIVLTNNINIIANLVLDLALNYTGAKTGSILMLTDNDELVIKAARGMDLAVMSGTRIKIGEGICGKVAMERKPILVKDIESKTADKYKTRSFICCPILIKDKLLGVININDKADSSPFTEDELDLIIILAKHSAIALENARLMTELERKSTESEEMNRDLIEADRLKIEFIFKISHELRTPLNSIKGAIHYLKGKKTGLNAEQTEFIEIISDETDKLVESFDKLLDFSRYTRETYLSKKRVINLNEILADVAATKTVNELCKNKGLSISHSLQEGLSDIIGDRIRLLQLFINLFEGCVRYAKRGDTVELKTSETESAVETELIIKNRQIPESEITFIFNNHIPWFWIDTQTEKLKFYLMRKILDIHKGKIFAFNAPKGFSIKTILPKTLKERREVEIIELTNLFVSFIAKVMGINICSLMLTNELTGELTIKAAYGLEEALIKKTRLKLGDPIAGWVAVERRPLLVQDIEKTPFIRRPNNLKYTTKSLLSLPIKIQERITGVLNLNNKDDGQPFDKKDLYIGMTFSNRISEVLKKLYIGDIKQKEFKSISNSLENLLRAQENYKKDNKKITDIVFQLTTRLGCSEDEICSALYAALLYDLGLTLIDRSILEKTQKLTPIEQKIIRTHPASCIGLIDYIEPSETIKKIILYHHERYDGTGYPEGLKGEDIPLISRVLSLADAYVSMTSERTYRRSLSHDIAIELINSGAGTQFDPKIVNIFNEVININL